MGRLAQILRSMFFGHFGGYVGGYVGESFSGRTSRPNPCTAGEAQAEGGATSRMAFGRNRSPVLFENAMAD
ncbi:MAG: hypothetical protein ACLQFM_04775, partial [Terriglobales bacterium]